MKSKLCLVAFALNSLLLISCQKEYSVQRDNSGNGPAPVDFTGTWDIVEVASQGSNSSTTAVAAETLKSVVEYAYFSKNTTGKMLVDDKVFLTQDLNYIIDTTMTLSVFSNGALLTSADMPFYMEVVQPSNPLPYRKISADSILITGQLTSAPSGAPIQSEEMGFRLMMAGDTLVMKGNLKFAVRQTVNGLPANIEANTTNLIKLLRP